MALCLAGVFSTSVRADAGTPLMFASASYLFLGNFLIGVAEGLVLASFFKVRMRRAVPVMILANYTSAFGGFMFAGRPEPDLYHAWRAIWTTVLFTWLLTVLIEWPFIAFVLGRKPRLLVRSILATLIIQTLSYAIIVAWLGSVSDTSLITRTELVPSAEIKIGSPAALYFIGDKDGDVYRLPLAGGQAVKIDDLGSTGFDDRLIVVADQQRPAWNLYVLLSKQGRGWEENRVRLIQRDFVRIATDREGGGYHAPLPRDSDDAVRNQVYGTWGNFGKAADLRSTPTQQWIFKAGFWPVEGLLATNQTTSSLVHIAMETPVVNWYIRSATVLPGDQVVFQLGRDQICLYDRPTNRLTLLARGRGPVVGLD